MAAIGLWVIAGSWCARYGTFGRIPRAVVAGLFDAERLALDLVAADLWEVTDDGWKFVHWRKWQDGDYRPNIKRRIREAVFERDGHQCVACGSRESLSLDHIIRYRDDGPDTIDNLRVLCMPCNVRRG
jgi:hypothetical protein